MNRTGHLAFELSSRFIQRPLSLLTGIMAIGVILYGLYARISGQMYLEGLNWIDTMTPVMISILLLRAVISLRDSTDLQAVSLALIGALSFIFIYEAIYKLSFYAPPHDMPSEELREFLIQTGIALTALAGFAFGKFRLTAPSIVFLAIFVLSWIFWLLVGFPQVDNVQNYYSPVIDLNLDWNWIYVINRGTKVAMFFAYFFFYAPPQRADKPITQAAK
jgi:hypothetical protein